MAKIHVLVATYGSLATGRNAVQSLLTADFRREDIGLAAKQGAEDGALVTVTVSDENASKAREALEEHGPQTLQTREVQWRKEGLIEEIPDADDYTAINLTE